MIRTRVLRHGRIFCCAGWFSAEGRLWGWSGGGFLTVFSSCYSLLREFFLRGGIFDTETERIWLSASQLCTTRNKWFGLLFFSLLLRFFPLSLPLPELLQPVVLLVFQGGLGVCEVRSTVSDCTLKCSVMIIHRKG